MSRKLQEKQRRREAEERRRAELRRAARRRNLLTFGAIGLVGVLVVALVVSERSKKEEGGDTSKGAIGVAAASAGCTDIERPEDMGNKHVEVGSKIDYNTSPPTSGNHYADPAAAGFYSTVVDPPQLVHNMEHGQVVIWYRSDASQDVIDDIEAYVGSDESGVALVATPYDDIPSQFTFAVTAWTALQECAQVSTEVLDDFRAEFQGKGPEDVGIPTFSA